MKKTSIAIIVIVLIGLAIYFFTKSPATPAPATEQAATTTDMSGTNGIQASSTPATATNSGPVAVLGQSAGGHDISIYHYGSGKTEVLFVGGIHGGYEWNTVLEANDLMNYLQANPNVIPANVKISVIPVMNPDGLLKVVGTTTGNFTAGDVSTDQATVIAGRFNGNNVDLNRNFDCDWQAKGTWQNKPVSGGSSVFSESESQAVKNYVDANKPSAVVVWYSAAGGVYSSSCHNGVSTDTAALTKAYANASGYTANQSFDSYATTGDMTNWLAKEGIPAISVLLTNHSDVEWSKNLAGIKAVLQYYSQY